MFCGNCGTKVDDGVVFCPNCGTRLGGTVTEAAAPVQETVAQTFEQAAAPVQETIAQAAQPFTAPTQETAIPRMPEIPQVNGIQEPAGTSVPPVQPVQPLQPEFNVRPEQPERISPFPSASAESEPASEAPAKKKKGKGGLIAGVTAAAVVVGGAGVGYFGFHDKLTHTFMGDVGYAQMINQHASANVTENEAVGKLTDTAIVMMLDSAMSSRLSEVDSDRALSSASGQALFSQMLLGSAATGDYKALMDQALEAIPEGTIVSSSTNLKIEPGSVFTLISDGQVFNIIKKIGEFSFDAKLAKGSTDMFSLGLSDKDGNVGTVEVYVEGSGDLILAFPDISDKMIRISREYLESLTNGDGEEQSATSDVTFSETEAARIRKDITDIYYNSFNSAAVSYADAVLSLGENEWKTEVKGTGVSVTFTADAMKALGESLREYLQNDAYLISYAKDRFGLSEEDYKSIFKPSEEQSDSEAVGDTEKSDPTVTVEHIVDVHNNVLGTRCIINDGKDTRSITFESLGDDKQNAFGFTFTDEDGKQTKVNSFSHSENGSDGSSLLVIRNDNTETEFGFRTDFTGKGTAQWLGNDVEVGTYTLTLADPDKFVESVRKLSEGGASSLMPDNIYSGMSNDLLMPVMNEEDDSDNPFGIDTGKLIEELKKLQIVRSAAVSGNTMTSEFSASAGDLGKITSSSTSVSESGTVNVPDSTKAIDIDDPDAFSGLAADAITWIGGVTEKLGLGDISSLFGGVKMYLYCHFIGDGLKIVPIFNGKTFIGK